MLLDHVALHLQAGRELTLLLGQIPWKHSELLDRLPPVQLMAELVDVGLQRC